MESFSGLNYYKTLGEGLGIWIIEKNSRSMLTILCWKKLWSYEQRFRINFSFAMNLIKRKVFKSFQRLFKIKEEFMKRLKVFVFLNINSTLLELTNSTTKLEASKISELLKRKSSRQPSHPTETENLFWRYMFHLPSTVDSTIIFLLFSSLFLDFELGFSLSQEASLKRCRHSINSFCFRAS